MAKSKTITRNDVQNILAHINLGDDAHREITQAEFDALSATEQNDGTIYFITDGASNNMFLDDNTPIGTIAPYGGSSDPAYWLICDGRAVSRTAYAELFAVIGITYGAGDGSTTFNIPDLRGKVAIGVNSTYTLGSSGGSETVTLTYTNAGILNSSSEASGYGLTATSAFQNRVMVSRGAGATAHNNMQPYVVTNYIIKAQSAISAGQSQLDFFYPLGSYYETTDSNFNPNEQWGGSWQLVGTDSFSLDRQILWTNSNVSTNFGETTISISNLSDYDEVDVVWLYATSMTTTNGGTMRIPIGSSGVLSEIGGTNGYNSGSITLITRLCTVNSDNIYISRASLAYDGATYAVGYDHNLIPYKIYGIKNLSHYKWYRVG